MYKFSNRSLNNLKGVHPNLQSFFNELIKITPYDFVITHGVRTAEEQHKLYQQGRTTPGITVTGLDGYKRISKHQIQTDGLGHANDIAVLINNEISWKEKYYEEIAEIAKPLMEKYNIKWGGTFKDSKGNPKPDRPHFELRS